MNELQLHEIIWYGKITFHTYSMPLFTKLKNKKIQKNKQQENRTFYCLGIHHPSQIVGYHCGHASLKSR